MENLAAHVDIVRGFGMRCVVGINRFPTDTARELDLVREMAVSFGADAGVVNDGFTSGGEGSVEMAEAVQRAVSERQQLRPALPARDADKGHR